MTSYIHLRAHGSVILSERVCCDGFAYDVPVRIQTHIHHDHMVDFNTSKANQSIVMSVETLDLLKAMYNADLPYRNNLRAQDACIPFDVDGDMVTLLPSNHMLGGVQVQVERANGHRVGYSSDFFWPLERVIEVDELLVDSTYGDPLRARQYDQAKVDELLLDTVHTRLRSGRKVAVIGYNGRLQQAAALFGDVDVPVVFSSKASPLMEVYRSYGYHIPYGYNSARPESKRCWSSPDPLLAFVTLHELRHLPWIRDHSKVTLSAHMSGPQDPLVEYPNGDCCLALTDHADFEGTIAYVEATGATRVWTDSRSGDAFALAEAIKARLNVNAAVVQAEALREWG